VHAEAPLQVQLPEEQVLVVPVQFESDVQAEQPLAVQVVPALQTPLPLQVQAPAVQVLVEPVQSALVQQLVLGMQVPTQRVWPLGQPQPAAVQVRPPVQGAAPLQVHAPDDVQVLVVPVHCELEVQEASAQAPLSQTWPEGQSEASRQGPQRPETQPNPVAHWAPPEQVATHSPFEQTELTGHATSPQELDRQLPATQTEPLGQGAVGQVGVSVATQPPSTQISPDGQAEAGQAPPLEPGGVGVWAGQAARAAARSMQRPGLLISCLRVAAWRRRLSG
jgi:hypothetical protein